MKKNRFAVFFAGYLICLIAFLPHVFGQQPAPDSTSYGLKGDVLGETIQEFRVKHERTVTTVPGSKVTESIHLPECTTNKLGDDISYLPRTGTEFRANVMQCRIVLNDEENSRLFLVDHDYDPSIHFDLETIAEVVAFQTIYYFYAEHLYKIQAELPAEDYDAIRNAFVSKYGSPIISRQRYQNLLGAITEGEHLLWKKGSSRIQIDQLDGSKYDGTENQTQITYWDETIKQQVESAGAPKDRTKDM